MHHPYDDFAATVLRLLDDAAEDPAVVALKLTLYRTGENSPVVAALLRAAEAGKEVVVFVELKASYDEARNIGWVKQLERAGAQVVYGWWGSRITRRWRWWRGARTARSGATRTSGTGNYNAATARFYTDLGLLTADPAIGDDLGDLFNQLTGTLARAGARPCGACWWRPSTCWRGLARAHRAARRSTRGPGGRDAIRAKLNGLDDPEVIRALYEASQAGVEIDLIVRGLCTLKPGVPGLSERIRVRGMVGRFLEHARIYHFANAGDDEYFIASADWRSRNLRRRVEVAAPVLDPVGRRRLADILARELADPVGLGARARRQLPAADQLSRSATRPPRRLERSSTGLTAREEEVVWTG